MTSEDLRKATSLITQIWALSKKSHHNTDHLLSRLNEILFRLLPDRDAYPNPIDWVIPTWETLWRVVATTIAYTHGNATGRSSFQDLLLRPCKAEFQRRDGDAPSAEQIVKEAMRLKPPSKRISRLKPTRIGTLLPYNIALWIGNYAIDRVDAADVESLHLSSDIWGVGVGEFDPSRHSESRLTVDQSQSMMPFGHGTLQCIAKNHAPMIVGILAGAIFDRVESGMLEIGEGTRIGERDGWDGWTVRSATN